MRRSFEDEYVITAVIKSEMELARKRATAVWATFL